MSALALALEKQRLQLAAAAQRTALSGYAEGLHPLFATVDQIRAGACWARRNPEIVAGGAALVIAVRPGTRRFFWRWGRRAFVAWRVWRDSQRWLENTAVPVSPQN